MTDNSAVLAALSELFGDIEPYGRSGCHQFARVIRPDGSTWEIRTPIAPDLAGFFDAELALVKSLQHQSIIAIVEQGIVEAIPFYAVEAGIDLFERLRSADVFTTSDITAMLLDLASALEYCHRRGVIHGAINPRNVQFQRGTVVLDGFCESVARRMREDLEFMATGNPTYVSAELCRGEQLDPRSDIYGLGAVAYLCLAGQPAHQADSATEIIFRKMAPCPPLSVHRADIDPHMAHLVESTLAPDVRDRPQTAREFIEVLSNVQLR